MNFTLNTTSRQRQGEKDRAAGLLPAVIYGANQNNISLSLNYADFFKLLDNAGYSNLIDIKIDGQDGGKILIHDVQYDPVTDKIIHVDFKRIEMDKEIETTIEINFIGEAPAIKEHGGALVKNLEEVEVKCLPKDLVSEITVDLSVLKTFDDIIRVKDLNIPAGIIVINPSGNITVAKAVPALTDEQLKAMETQGVDVSKVEVAGEKKEEETDETGEAKEGEPKKEEKKDEPSKDKPVKK